jgi:hypothetical protein
MLARIIFAPVSFATIQSSSFIRDSSLRTSDVSLKAVASQ